MGKWYKVAVVSSCPHFMKRKSAHPVVATVHLQHAPSAPNVTKTTTVFWSDSHFYKGLCCGFFTLIVSVNLQEWYVQADDLTLRLDRHSGTFFLPRCQ